MRYPSPVQTLALDGIATVLIGTNGGKYPHGNSLLVHGTHETVIVDPSLTLAESPLPAPTADRVLLSHAHEDHLAGVFRYPRAPVHAHEADVDGVRSLDGLVAIFGYTGDLAADWKRELLDHYRFVPRPDAQAFRDGDVFDPGGTRVHVVHLPGHTGGHSAFLLDPQGIAFLADVDLSGFGPYYGDASSSVDDFERSLRRCREIDARWYVTFHHKGVVDGRSAFLALLDEYEAVIGRREATLLAYLSEPRSLDDIVAHRFIYRRHVTLLFVEAVERRSAELHLARLMRAGMAAEVEPGRFRATAGRAG